MAASLEILQLELSEGKCSLPNMAQMDLFSEFFQLVRFLKGQVRI